MIEGVIMNPTNFNKKVVRKKMAKKKRKGKRKGSFKKGSAQAKAFMKKIRGMRKGKKKRVVKRTVKRVVKRVAKKRGKKKRSGSVKSLGSKHRLTFFDIGNDTMKRSPKAKLKRKVYKNPMKLKSIAKESGSLLIDGSMVLGGFVAFDIAKSYIPTFNNKGIDLGLEMGLAIAGTIGISMIDKKIGKLVGTGMIVNAGMDIINEVPVISNLLASGSKTPALPPVGSGSGSNSIVSTPLKAIVNTPYAR